MAIEAAPMIVLATAALRFRSALGRWSWPHRLSLVLDLAVAGLALLGFRWKSLVTKASPEPYLDEVFHIPQAQAFCEGRFSSWDDKITTPPGLYLISYAFHFLQNRILGSQAPCTASELRALNAAALVVVFHLSVLCRFEIEAQRNTSRALSTYALHTGLNIAFFPVLFFFSGLYYTEVVSTAVVLLVLEHQLRRIRLRHEGEAPGWASDLAMVGLGVLALFMRQTNVFWVVVFNGGLEAIDAVKAFKMPRPEPKDQTTTLAGRLWQTLQQYAAGHIHDPLVNAAWLDDVALTAISIALAVAFNPVPVLKRVWPHLTLLGLFGSFVAWNGGVVLGDRSNHVATIHISQMLYIWPFFSLFLAPLLMPFLLRMLSHPLQTLGLTFNTTLPVPAPSAHLKLSKPPPTAPDRVGEKSTTALRMATLLSLTKSFRPLAALVTVILFAVVVRFNTIVHPFTLADNRHYMFYIFRRTIRHSQAIRLILVVPYALGLLFSWNALSAPTPEHGAKTCQGRFVNHPFLPAPQPCPLAQEPDKVHPNRSSAVVACLDARESRASEPVAVSMALLVVLASGLSLVTAPLVEPRYFIIPWVMWRLLVPAWQPARAPEPPANEPQTTINRPPPHPPRPGVQGMAWAVAQKHDVRLLIETAWFALINLVTMYIFLYWPFVWRTPEGGILDDGRMQRFMW